MSKYTVVDPQNTILEVDSLAKYAKLHGLDRKSLSKVVQGKQNHHKGHHVFMTGGEGLDEKLKKITKVIVRIVHPLRTSEKIVKNLAEYCVESKLDYYGVLNCLKNKTHYYSGRYIFAEKSDEKYITKVIEEHKKIIRERADTWEARSLDWTEEKLKYSICGEYVGKKTYESMKAFDDDVDIAY